MAEIEDIMTRAVHHFSKLDTWFPFTHKYKYINIDIGILIWTALKQAA